MLCIRRLNALEKQSRSYSFRLKWFFPRVLEYNFCDPPTCRYCCRKNQMPHYHIVEATEAVKPVLGEYFVEPEKSGPIPFHLMKRFFRGAKVTDDCPHG